MNIVVRWARSEDLDAVAAIARQNWSHIYEGYREILGDALYALAYTDPMDAKEASVRKAGQEGRMFVAELEGQICGFATYRVEGVLGTLSENAVASAFRGRGIARLLYERVFAQLKEAGCQAVSLTTGLDDAHGPARRAYEKMGFEKALLSIRYFRKL